MILLSLLKSSEGPSHEFKRDLSSPEGVLTSIIAFANRAGGTLILGVENSSRRVFGIADPVDVEERLANLIVDCIEPRVLPQIEILPWRRTHVIAVEVFPSPNRPHYLRKYGRNAGTYVRVGSTNRKADEALIREIERSTRLETFDEEPMPSLNSEAIDFRAASESFASVRKLKRSDLETLRLVTRHQRRVVPTVGGVLLFGTDRLQHFPDARLQLGRFAGADKSIIIDHADHTGSLIEGIDRAIQFLQRNMSRAAEIGSVRRRDLFALPPVAIREAIVNAVAHCDYSQRGAPIRIALYNDRLEIENPGILPLGLTLDDLTHGVSKLRNRVIGRVMHELGVMEHWGSGVQRMSSACTQAGLPDPQFEEIGLRFRVTLRSERSTRTEVAPLDQKILDYLSNGEGRSTAQIAAHVGRTPRATRTRLAALVDVGLVRDLGSGPTDPQRRYFKS